MKRNLLSSIVAMLVSIGLFSCSKSKGGASAPVVSNGLYVLNLAAVPPSAYTDSSTLSFYNFSNRQFTPDLYSAVNGKLLGQGASDMGIYGTRMYILLTDPGVISVVDPRTGKLIKQVSVPLQPKYLAFSNGNIYIGCNSGKVAVLDTLDLSVKSTITLPGRSFWLTGLVATNNKLYVSNPNAPGYDVTDCVVAIDLTTNQVIKTIHVIPNPGSIAADSYGNVYVESNYTDDWQMYNVTTGGMTIIDSKTDTIRSSFTSTGNNFAPVTVSGDLVYYSINNKFSVYNARTQSQENTTFVKDGTVISYPLAICVNPVTGEVYIAEYDINTSNSVVDVFDKTGKLEYSFPTEFDPLKILLIN